jgi:hypothetical protein
MRRWALMLLVGMCAGLLGPAGCRDKARDLSKAETLLARQHELWDQARKTLQSDQPSLERLVDVAQYLGGRVQRRVEKDYSGSNKAEVIAHLDKLGQAYNEQVMSRLIVRAKDVVLRPGVAIEDVRSAFAALEPEYQKLRTLTGG